MRIEDLPPDTMDLPPGPGPLREEDFWAFPEEEGVLRQLVDGWEVVVTAPGWVHQMLVGEIFRQLANFLRIHDFGRALVAPYAIRLSDRDVLLPDVLYLPREVVDGTQGKCFRGAPALVVEILSPTTRRIDELRKLRRYQAGGVEEYWVVDPEIRAIRVYRLAGGRLDLDHQARADAGDRLETALLPGFALELAELFADAEADLPAPYALPISED